MSSNIPQSTMWYFGINYLVVMLPLITPNITA